MLIPLDSNPGNTCVFGRTRSGKTYGTIWSLDKSKRGVLFFNVQLGTDVPGHWIDADASDDIESILAVLASGGKVNYLPSTSREYADREFAAIINALYDGTVRDVYVVPDEAHLYKGVAEDALVRLITTGLRFGLRTVAISQRPAELNYTVMTQSTLFVVYAVSQMEWPYFAGKKFPVDDMRRLQAGAKPHSYLLVDTTRDDALSGPFAV